MLDYAKILFCFLKDTKDFWLVVLGGLMTLSGSIVIQFINLKTIRKQKTEELMAKEKLTVYKKATFILAKLAGLILQGTSKEAWTYLESNEDWFWENEIIFSQEFINKYLSIKKHLRAIALISDRKNYTENDIMKLTQTEESLDNLVKDAREILRLEYGLSPIKPERLPFERKPLDN